MARLILKIAKIMKNRVKSLAKESNKMVFDANEIVFKYFVIYTP